MIDELNLKRDKSKEQLINFLRTQSLRYEDVDTCFVIRDAGKIVATASKKDNVFKMIAVSCHFQSHDYVAKLITALIERCHDQGIYHYFIFTKLIYLNHFQATGFKLIASYNEVGLFEMGNFSFMKQINDFKNSIDITKQTGAIVMNANPFTLGHHFLVEYASKQVEQLIVFVLEQDSSYFNFEARFSMVKAGCSAFENVIVLPSGPYMISAATFPTYFLKEVSDKNEMYMNLDIAIFKRLMDELNITLRFVGSEPMDEVTNLYNTYLQKSLTSQLVIIDRLMLHHTTISATHVRELFLKKDYSLLKEWVPQSTYNFLRTIEQ